MRTFKRSTGTLRNSFCITLHAPSLRGGLIMEKALLGPCESERPIQDTWLACVYCHILPFWNISWTIGLETLLEHMFCFSFLRKTRRSVMQEMIERASDKKQVTKVSGKFNGIDKGFHSSLEDAGVLVWKEYVWILTGVVRFTCDCFLIMVSFIFGYSWYLGFLLVPRWSEDPKDWRWCGVFKWWCIW